MFIRAGDANFRNSHRGFTFTDSSIPSPLRPAGFCLFAVQSAGAAAATLLPEGYAPLTVEFKLNLLRPALCDTLLCRAEVLKPGKQISVVEAEVFALQDGKKRLFSKATVTIAVVSAEGLA